MPQNPPGSQPQGLDLNAILFIVFRHKWKILLCALTGFALAAFVYFRASQIYESDAKLMVRYVVERSGVDATDTQQTTTAGRANDTIIGAEIEILTSWDVATQVAEKLGPERILERSGGPKTVEAAAQAVAAGLVVTGSTGSNVIQVAYRSRDPALAVQVLDAVVDSYFVKHLEAHRSAGGLDFVSQEADQVHRQLLSTDDQLKQLRMKAGIISLPDAVDDINTRATKTQQDLADAQADLSEQRALVATMDQSAPIPSLAGAPAGATSAAGGPAPAASTEVMQQYEAIATQLASLRQTELGLLAKYTPENEMVQLNRTQIDNLEREVAALEAEYPGLAAMAPKGDGVEANADELDPAAERAKLAGAEARVASLRGQLIDLEEAANKIADAAPQISDLERRKDVEETNYKYYESSLDQAQVDEALDPSKMPNISIIQKPSPARHSLGKVLKIVVVIAMGGVAAGFGLAFFIDLVLDQSVKRRTDIESRLRIPVMLTIPYLGPQRRSPRLFFMNGIARNGASHNGSNGHVSTNGHEPSVPDPGRDRSMPAGLASSLARYCDSIRDLLILSFELNLLTHKPKLVAVTGLSGGEGVSTIVAGLAASLSETGDDKVLLVAMHGGVAKMHHFSRGKSVGELSDVLQNGEDIASSTDSLFLGTAGQGKDRTAVLSAKGFYRLASNLRDSAFDYIVFDMPPLTQSAATLAVSKSMDKVLVVVEAGISNPEALKRAFLDLAAAGANASAILNMVPQDFPKILNVC
ncbi:MAG: Wzz/FepE/Etk N-terminal domain-containing protein [Chthoniobacteraceae bacterium]|jgi:uncharacterized protein involved in exopolysaccharide biosynthesis/Mrp family chromosome partitioning ATPase